MQSKDLTCRRNGSWVYLTSLPSTKSTETASNADLGTFLEALFYSNLDDSDSAATQDSDYCAA